MNLMSVIFEVIPPRILLFNNDGKKELLKRKYLKVAKNDYFQK